MYKYYVLRNNSDDKINRFEVVKPYEALWFAITNRTELNANIYNYKKLEENINEILNELHELERQVIICRFGFDGDFLSLRATGEKLNLSGESIRLKEKRALRKLRLPIRLKRIRCNGTYSGSIISQRDGIDYSQMIINEMKSFYRGGRTEYLEGILKKNEIDIAFARDMNLDIQTDTLNLSVRTFDFLRRANINTIDQLKELTREDLYKIRGLGKKSMDEILNAIDRLSNGSTQLNPNRRVSSLVSFSIEKNAQKREYRLGNLNDEEIAECLYDILSNEYSKYGNITEYNISNGLLNVLLLKGYFYIETIVKDYDKLVYDFTQGGLQKCLQELEDIKHQIEEYIMFSTSPQINIVKLDKTVWKEIITKKPNDIYRLIECCDTLADKERDDYKNAIMEHFWYPIDNSHIDNLIDEKIEEMNKEDDEICLQADQLEEVTDDY